MTPATADRPAKKNLKERAKFAATLASQGKPVKVTVKRQKEAVDSETGKKFAVPDTGLYIHFVDEGNGIQSYTTDDPEIIQLLRVRANEHGVFAEVPIPKPDSGPVLRQILTLSLKRDVEALVAIGAEEEQEYQRDDVMEAVAEALEALS